MSFSIKNYNSAYIAFSKSFQQEDAIGFIRNKDLFEPKSSYPALKWARTMIIYMWDFRTEKIVEIESIILADACIMSFIWADCRVPKADLVK